MRRLRKSAQLTQHELGALLNLDQSSISRIESGELVDLPTLFALHVLFAEVPQALFPDAYHAAADDIVRRAGERDLELATYRQTRRVRSKREWLRQMMSRVTPQPA